MAEDREGLSPQEQTPLNPERAKSGVREAVRGVLNGYINENPVVREQARNCERVNAALPEGRAKDAIGLAVDAVKVPQAAFATVLEFAKRIPGMSFVTFFPEKFSQLKEKVVGFMAEKVVESGPVQMGVRTVDGIVDGILGERRPAPAKATLENSHQILVGMARAETKK
ncbi:MAG: hypothetical protein Q8L37_03060 [Candidatus Gottesmanbacteria bacterium]|nr:hypothetical protein [Candidatus Gottesmanbacteria bacterium]